MKIRTITLLIAVAPFLAQAQDDSPGVAALLITGGGYHDYENQKTILTQGLAERIKVDWTIIHQDADATKEALKEPGWEERFNVDVVVYNMCHAGETDAEYVKSLTETHAKGLPAVMIHCALHSYHWKTDSDDWVRLLGVTSMRHGKHAPIHVKTVAPDLADATIWPASPFRPKAHARSRIGDGSRIGDDLAGQMLTHSAT